MGDLVRAGEAGDGADVVGVGVGVDEVGDLLVGDGGDRGLDLAVQRRGRIDEDDAVASDDERPARIRR
jgi:hypothetical protein